MINMKLPASVIHLEDDLEWHNAVKRSLSRQELHFQEYFTPSTIDEFKQALRKASAPPILIVDLRLGEDEKTNYGGYHWIIDELRDLFLENPRAVIFVLSAQLTEGIEETLRWRGITKAYVFSKGDWAEKRFEFVDRLVHSAAQLGSLRNDEIHLSEGDMVDPYLFHRFSSKRALDEDVRYDSSPITMAMIVQTKHPEWDYSEIPDLEIWGQIENIFSCRGTYRSMMALKNSPNVLSVEASRKTGHMDAIEDEDENEETDSEYINSIFQINASNIHEAISETGDNAIVAIIDTGIDVLHEAFRDSSNQKTRIIAMWDQTNSVGTPPSQKRLPKKQFGSEYSSDDINEMIQTGSVPIKLRVKPKCHGTHVASIAAGKRTSHFLGGVAPEAKIIFVKSALELDIEAGDPYSIGYSKSHLIALEYIRNVADEYGLPVVINVSQGMNAGAHDGSSKLEKGFDLITGNGDTGGIVIVKSAGNERNKRLHASVEVAKNVAEKLQWISTSTESTNKPRDEDYLEVWFSAVDDYLFRLIHPNSEASEWIGINNRKSAGSFSDGNRYSISYTRRVRDNQDSRLVIIVEPGKNTTIAEGTWTLEIFGIDTMHGKLDAWIERSFLQEVFFLQPYTNINTTLSIPGTAKHIISVGSIGISEAGEIRLADYSSFGPTRDGRQKPELVAPGYRIRAAASNTDFDVTSMNGTSMAAPHVTGAIALLLSARYKKSLELPNATIVQGAIRQTTQYFNNKWHPGIGYGVLDAYKFFSELIDDIFH